MKEQHILIISKELGLQEQQVRNTLELLADGATIPFISRYRKEATGSLDEVQVAAIKSRYERLLELDKRRTAILGSMEEQGKLTAELKRQIEAAESMSGLEDIYLPYKPKRKTRASVARERGLEPLAQQLMQQIDQDVESLAGKYLSDELPAVEDVLQGARDIIAEQVNEDARARDAIRRLFDRDAVIYSKLVKNKEKDGEKYRDYFDFSESLRRCPSHRLLAMLRGKEEAFLRISIEPDERKALDILYKQFVKGRTAASAQVEEAVKDGYRRLLCPSIETEFEALAKERADDESINVFTDNLRQLLLASPLGQKNVLAIDPGFRTGCKVVCLDAQGNLRHNETIYPHKPQSEVVEAKRKIMQLVSAYKIDTIAIGNGTAGRETERFIQSMAFGRDLQVFIVNESGASIYSASAVAREEFPNYDVTVRGAVSIGRRLMDPLAELVKIDPKSIGVGQYQHDVDQNKLKKSLDMVVESCVNLVGVNVNTASKHLLVYVSGLGPQLAQNIIDYRKENGPFPSRKALKNVSRMGDKSFEQCAGFLRISDAENPLDNSAVHPESYHIVQQMAEDMSATVNDLLKNERLRKQIKLDQYVTSTVGLPTLNDIMKELAKPGLDPRAQAKVFEFAQDVHRVEDLQPGMVLPGIVTNITNFGCFVDVGVKQDGLVHVSQLTDKYVKHPSEAVKLNQHVKVKVLEV
ncbi:MAG: RNA-binding transcriptional accessory protein, partial [Bacteroidales bacterium]|nr:RNA-binding transcriptional accessory protein [Bacteroidales bacterium]